MKPGHFQGHFHDTAVNARMKRCHDFLEKNFTVKSSMRRMVDLGDGNGAAIKLGPYCHIASQDGVTVVFTGEVAHWPDVSPDADPVADNQNKYVSGEQGGSEADRLLKYYRALLDVPTVEEVCERALESLGSVEGPFAFVIFDSMQRRVLAARDKDGAQSLDWGVTNDGLLCFGTDFSMLGECVRPTAVPFPAGCLYTSAGNHIAESPGEEGWVIEGEQWPGHVSCYMHGMTRRWRPVQAVPRVDSHGCICGNVFRVASERDVPNVQGAA
ncbi:unnamed protein product [Pedinophyceae sp. YPF-701]|nr:unnamed protein product [Pedinophyceae sp. YPF-701]